MTMASAMHFAGYEFARASTMALFVPSNMSLALGCVSPVSVALLWVRNINECWTSVEERKRPSE